MSNSRIEEYKTHGEDFEPRPRVTAGLAEPFFEGDEQRLVTTAVAVNTDVNGLWMRATLGLIRNYAPYIKTLNVIVQGTLNRWHYWNLSSQLTDQQLSTLLADVPAQLSSLRLAELLATKFLPKAKEIEDEYIKSHFITLSKMAKDFPELRPRMFNWEKVGIAKGTDTAADIADFRKRKAYYAVINAKCQKKSALYNHLNHSINQFITAQSTIILRENARIRRANPNLQFLSAEYFERLVFECCYNYFIEKATTLLPVMVDQGYTCVIHTDELESVDRIVQRIFADKKILVNGMIYEPKRRTYPDSTASINFLLTAPLLKITEDNDDDYEPDSKEEETYTIELDMCDSSPRSGNESSLDSSLDTTDEESLAALSPLSTPMSLPSSPTPSLTGSKQHSPPPMRLPAAVSYVKLPLNSTIDGNNGTARGTSVFSSNRRLNFANSPPKNGLSTDCRPASMQPLSNGICNGYVTPPLSVLTYSRR